MIKAVFFDAGHTLIHPDPPVGEAYAREAARLGASVSGERIEKVFVDTFGAFARLYSADVASDEQDRAMWREITRRVYQRTPELAGIDYEAWFARLYDFFGHASAWRPYPDVGPAVAELRRRGMRLGIISNWDRRLRTIVREMDLAPCFDTITISAEVGVRKPNPRIFHRALEALGVAPDEAIHAGDLLEEDVVGARRAGLQAVLVDRGRFAMPEGVAVVRDLREFASRVTREL